MLCLLQSIPWPLKYRHTQTNPNTNFRKSSRISSKRGHISLCRACQMIDIAWLQTSSIVKYPTRRRKLEVRPKCHRNYYFNRREFKTFVAFECNFEICCVFSHPFPLSVEFRHRKGNKFGFVSAPLIISTHEVFALFSICSLSA